MSQTLNLKGLLQKQNLVILLITFIVAFCSIVYELIFSQALTVIFGGTVTRYSVTIGLYLFSLGIGALLFGLLKRRRLVSTFLILEIVLSFSGILGVLFMIWLNSAHMSWGYSEFGRSIIMVLSHLPVVFVGILSGLEIPILSQFMKDRDNAFSEVLGIDYIGSLAGTLIYSLWLYPQLGLIVTVIVVGALNFLVALLFYLFYESKKTRKFWHSAVVVIGLGIFSVLFTYQESIHNHMTKMFMGAKIEDRFWSFHAPLKSVEILEFFNTPYQMVTLFKTSFDNADYNPDDLCLNLDTHIQMCDDWYLSYHQGLVDVPMALFGDEKLEVLLIGGGDFIALDHLKKYDVNLTQVDIDAEFMEYAKVHPYLTSKNHHIFETFENWDLIVTDAFRFLRGNEKKFDLILVDLPGIEHDRLLHVYSQEFYQFMARSLTEKGLMVSWIYPETDHTKQHRTILFETLRSAGFKSSAHYHAYKNFTSPAELFYVFSPRENEDRLLNLDKNSYLRAYGKAYKKFAWEVIPSSLVRSNSIFRPNYKIVVELPYLPKPVNQEI